MSKSRIRDHYNSVAEDYKHIKQFPERIIEKLDIRNAMCILDIGCGAGNLTFELAEAFNAKKIVGIDISNGLIDEAKKIQKEKEIGNIEFICGDAEELPFDDACFDVITSNMVFHLFKYQFSVLKEAHRVLKPGGNVVFQFQGQRPVAPEYFSLIKNGWDKVFGSKKRFPALFRIARIDEIDGWMNTLRVEKSEVTWRSNTVQLSRDQLKKFINYIPLVSGFWKNELKSEEITKIEEKCLGTLLLRY